MNKKNSYMTHPPREKQVTMATEGAFTRGKNVPGAQVSAHELFLRM